MELNIVYEDGDIIVCEKPVGTPSQSDKTGDFDMVNYLKNYVYEKDHSGPPYIGLVHRLDRPVGGIMVFAKTPQAAKGLSEQLRLKEMKKKYVAVVTANLSEEIGKEKGCLVDYLKKDTKTNLSTLSTKKDPKAKKAELCYRVLSTKDSSETAFPQLSLLDIELLTGRHHQIRLQLSNQMTGVWGDTKYNALFVNQKQWTNAALYAYYLEIRHPKTKKKLVFSLLPEAAPFDLFQEELRKLKR